MKAFSSRLKGLREKFGRLGEHPVFDWYCSLAVFCGLVLTVCAIGTFLYLRLGRADVVIPVTESATEARADFNIDSIERTLSGLRQRRESARSVPDAVLIDPSL